jgi:hypothetical protein
VAARIYLARSMVSAWHGRQPTLARLELAISWTLRVCWISRALKPLDWPDWAERFRLYRYCPQLASGGLLLYSGDRI